MWRGSLQFWAVANGRISGQLFTAQKYGDYSQVTWYISLPMIGRQGDGVI